MNRYTYDLHIHSCLSPCADDDMTPANIAGMASIQGLTLAALTDHNSAKNCPAFFACCKKYGIVPVAGMELTTSEEIHVICLFETLEGAMEFDGEVDSRRIRIPNRPDIFGRQYIMDADDEISGEEPDLLINGTGFDLDEAYGLVSSFGGVCYPAHVDRDSGGIISVLGDLPTTPDYSAFELNDKESYSSYVKRYPSLADKKYIVSSDAHNLWSISEGVNTIELEDEEPGRGYSSAFVRHSLIGHLKRR